MVPGLRVSSERNDAVHRDSAAPRRRQCTPSLGRPGCLTTARITGRNWVKHLASLSSPLGGSCARAPRRSPARPAPRRLWWQDRSHPDPGRPLHAQGHGVGPGLRRRDPGAPRGGLRQRRRRERGDDRQDRQGRELHGHRRPCRRHRRRHPGHDRLRGRDRPGERPGERRQLPGGQRRGLRRAHRPLPLHRCDPRAGDRLRRQPHRRRLGHRQRRGRLLPELQRRAPGPGQRQRPDRLRRRGPHRPPGHGRPRPVRQHRGDRLGGRGGHQRRRHPRVPGQRHRPQPGDRGEGWWPGHHHPAPAGQLQPPGAPGEQRRLDLPQRHPALQGLGGRGRRPRPDHLQPAGRPGHPDRDPGRRHRHLGTDGDLGEAGQRGGDRPQDLPDPRRRLLVHHAGPGGGHRRQRVPRRASGMVSTSPRATPRRRWPAWCSPTRTATPSSTPGT